MISCVIIEDEEFSRTIVKSFIRRIGKLKLIAEYDSAIDGLQMVKQGGVDIVFLDIEMPRMNGIDFVRSLSSLPQVILITGRNDFATEAFEHGITDYLKKPISYKRFEKAIKKASNNLYSPISTINTRKDIYIRAEGKIIRLILEDIIYVEALSDYVKINTADKQYVVYATMKSLEKKLDSRSFIRVHRSYIINTGKVDIIENTLIITSKKHIPIGASYKENLFSKLNLL